MTLFGKEEKEKKKTGSGKDFTKADVDEMRIEDSYLRAQLADQIKNIARNMEQCRENLTKKIQLGHLKEIGILIEGVITIEEKVRHAEQGYSGISADYRMQYTVLKQLYDWDLRLRDPIADLKTSVTVFQSAVTSGNIDMMKQEMSNIRGKIRSFTELFEKRQGTVLGLEAK